VKYVFALPYHSCPMKPAFVGQKAIMALAEAAEATGFAAISVTDHPMPSETWRAMGHDTFDPFVSLAFAAAATERLRLMTHLVVVPYRNPFLLAKSVASLDALSGGRLELGMGLGYQELEFAALGVDFAQRNALFDESLEAMKLAWSGEPIHFEGRGFSARNVTGQPPPAQRPHPRLWFGGNAKATMRRIAQHGQGWMILPSTPEQAARRHTTPLTFDTIPGQFAELKRMAAELGRTDPIEAHFPAYESNGVDQRRIREAVQELADMGVGWVSWHGAADTVEGQKDEMRRFADEVMSKIPPQAP
jgi:probable F420-dependent oxidoreductase